ncbi:unnamed protein product, partial [Symbiodinium microadriaticum]
LPEKGLFAAGDRDRSGSLFDVELVEPSTAKLRLSVWDVFKGWLHEKLAATTVIKLFSCPPLLALVLRDYGEELYKTGFPLGYYRQLLAHSQRVYPLVKPHLGIAWEMVSRWEELQPVCHRTPMPEILLKGLLGLALQLGWFRWAAAAAAIFYGIARPGEVLRALRKHLLTPEDLLDPSHGWIYLRISKPKSRIKLGEAAVLPFLQQVWGDLRPGERLYPGSPAVYRRRWDRLLTVLGIPEGHGLTPASLRGGGAISAFHKVVVMEFLGRAAFFPLEVIGNLGIHGCFSYGTDAAAPAIPQQPLYGVHEGGEVWVDLLECLQVRDQGPASASMPLPVVEMPSKRLKVVHKDVSYSRVVKSRAAVDWKQQRSAQLEIGLQTWLELVLKWGPCVLTSHVEACTSRCDQLEVIGDILKGKAPSTILKRARALVLLQDFLKERDSSFPCAEEEVYQFLKVLERDKAPKSRIASVMEALNFTLYVVGVSELQGVCQSRRCKGLCVTECFTEARQAPPLTVDQLLQLHSALEGHSDPWARLFAGAALVCAYARCRWSDVQHTETVLWDLNADSELAYIELRIGGHKTCRLQSRRHRFLHAVAPALGIRPYGHLWKQCREQLGVEVSGSCPFMPAPDAQGQPIIRALDSDEATAWLRMLFGQAKVCGDTSSKSLKATVISWAAKRGVEPLSLQRLGYHASGGMDIVYSRDAQAPLVMLVERLLREVAEGSFRPDDTRSGRIVTSGAVPLAQPVQPVGSELNESLATSSGVASQARLQCKEEQLPGSKGDAEVLQVDSDSEGFASEGESMESSDEDEGQPIALVAQGHLVPAGFDVWRFGSLIGKSIHGDRMVSPDGSLHTALLGQGIKNFRQLAFSIGTPSVEPSAAQYLELATQIFGASPSLGNVAMLRDLHFESTTYVIQVFKEQATSDGTDTQVKRLPMPERAARAAEQQSSSVVCAGCQFQGNCNLRYSLIDKCNTMYESGALVWLAPSVCSKRDAEVSLGVNEKSPVVHLEKDSLKLAAPAQKIPVDLSSPLCLQWAWQRRGIALDQCSLLTWKVHEEYVHRLLNFLTAPVPAGWTQVKPEQLIRADKEVWTLLAREVPPPYKTLADGTKPLDQPFKAMAFDQRIQVWLSPVLNTGAPTGGSGSSTDVAIPEIPPHVPRPPRKPKLRKKASKLMPDAFKKCPRFAKGPTCWAFNGEGCSAETKDREKLFQLEVLCMEAQTLHIALDWAKACSDSGFQTLALDASRIGFHFICVLMVETDRARNFRLLEWSWAFSLAKLRVFCLSLVVDENISGDEVVLSKRRLKFVAKWTARAKELEAREAELQQSLPEHVRKILKGKRLLLWKEMIDEYDLPDKGLIDDMMAGFPLCGWLPKSSAFPAQVRRPEFSVDTLKHLADGLNKATREKMAQRQSPELEQATWNETLAELQSEWIWQAPDREEDIKVYARRFGLDQHGKIRVIDDCSCCGLNATVGVVERFVVHAIDRMASMLAYALEGRLFVLQCLAVVGRLDEEADPCDQHMGEDLGWLQQYIRVGFFTDYRNLAWHYYATNETTYAFLWLNSISYANLDFLREACPEAAFTALLLRAEERLPSREADLPLLELAGLQDPQPAARARWPIDLGLSRMRALSAAMAVPEEYSVDVVMPYCDEPLDDLLSKKTGYEEEWLLSPVPLRHARLLLYRLHACIGEEDAAALPPRAAKVAALFASLEVVPVAASPKAWEAARYFLHMAQRYDRLADFTIVLHPDVFEHDACPK